MSVHVSKSHTFYKTLKKEEDIYKRIEYTSLCQRPYTLQRMAFSERPVVLFFDTWITQIAASVRPLFWASVWSL